MALLGVIPLVACVTAAHRTQAILDAARGADARRWRPGFPPRRWIAVLLVMTVPGTACQAWRTEEVAPQAFVATRPPEQVRVTRTDGSTIVVLHPELVGDTLVGTGHNQSGRRDVRIPLTDVQRVETRGVSTSRTIVLGVGIAAGAFVLIVGLVSLACGGGGCSN